MTHNEEDFPIDNMRMEWAYKLFLQNAITGNLQDGMHNIERIEESQERHKRFQEILETLKVCSEDKEWVELTCTDEEIELIEQSAIGFWNRMIGFEIDSLDINEKAKSEHADWQHKQFGLCKTIIATRK